MNNVINISRRLWEVGNPVQLMRSIWKHKFLIEQMVKRDLSQRFRGSFLGMLWTIINPLFMLLIYTFVFSIIFKARWRPGTEDIPMGEFALILFAGLIPYNFFSEVIGRSSTIITQNPNYVKKVVFPLEILVIVSLGTAFITSLINLGILLISSLILLGKIAPTAIFIPLAYLPLFLLTLGLGWFLSSFGVYVRDTAQVVALVLQVLFFATPIFYSDTSVPENIRIFMSLNPLTMIVTNFRNLLLWNDFFALKSWLLWVAISGGLSILGYTWFMATRRGFADVL